MRGLLEVCYHIISFILHIIGIKEQPRQCRLTSDPSERSDMYRKAIDCYAELLERAESEHYFNFFDDNSQHNEQLLNHLGIRKL